MKDAMTTPLNYLRFKEFLIKMCFLTEQQATADTAENTLSFELWELIAPKVTKQLDVLSAEGNEELMDKMDHEYITEVQAQEVSIADLKSVVMAILRINDGKHFFNASEAPMP